jgi:hypothetical protein
VNTSILVQAGDERAWVHAEGGMDFHTRDRAGWWLMRGEPSERIQALALAVRAAAFPELRELTLADLAD